MEPVVRCYEACEAAAGCLVRISITRRALFDATMFPSYLELLDLWAIN